VDHPRAYFVCPDTDEPSGGVRVIYRHVDHLVSAGIDAAVVHDTLGFRPTWFHSERTPVVHSADVSPVGGRDLLVIPEVYGPDLGAIGPGVAKAVFNQNAYNTFAGYEEPAARTAYHHPEVLAAVAVSDDNAAYLRHAFPELDVRRTVNCVDPGLFHPPAGNRKARRIAWMPRKNATEAAQVLGILAARGVLDGWDLQPLQGLTEPEVAAALRDCAIFLSTGYPEGCPCPPKEAMACACVVIGYHGMGGRDYFDESHGFPVPQGDIVAFARTVEQVLARDPAELRDFGARAAISIARRYSPRAERDSVVAVWGALLERVAGRTPVRAAA
jgi:hypothetical protein